MIRIAFLMHLLISAGAFAAADLEIQSFQAIPEEKAVELKLSWINHGPQDSNHPGCNIYVYSNQRLLLSQNFALKPLAVQESRSDALSIDLPSETVTTIKAEIYDAQESDLQPSTNFTQVNIKPPDFKKTDLEIVDETIESAQPVKEKSVVIHLRLRNNGPEVSRNSKFSVELQIYSSTVTKVERRLARLAPGEEIEFKIPVQIPENISATEGVIQLQWISMNPELVDPSEENNQLLLPVALIPRMPDLLPKDIKIDRKGTLTFSILNKGNTRSKASITALYINGALKERYNTPELRPGGLQAFEYKDAKVSPDTQITVVADFNADVEESSEENNRLNLEPSLPQPK